MEMKNIFAIAAVLMLLASPVAFAREAESGGNSGSGKSLSVSSITGAVIQADSDDDDGTADQGSGDAAVSANAAATASVDDDGTADRGTGDTSAATAISSEASSSTSSDGSVRVHLSARPQHALVGSTITAVGTISYEDNSPSAAAMLAEKKFKVEIKMTGMDGRLSGMDSGKIFFESAEDGSQNRGRGSDDFVSATVKAVASIFGQSSDDSTDVKQEDKGNEGEPSDDSRGRGSSSSGGAVTAVSASNSGSASQERTDYIVLKSGEKKEITAFFKARTTGTKIVKMEVYESTGFDCPANTDPSAGAATQPCRENFRKVAETAVKVSVRGEMPPPPPGTNNSTNATVASGVIQMSSGWNMVSVPVMAKVSMERIQKECGSQEFAWRLTSSGYVKERVMVPGYGYWVKASQDCKLDVSAMSYTRELAQLSSGWNLVGAPGIEAQVSGFKGNCDITAGPWYYNNPNPAAAANPYSLSSAFSPGKAYWVKVSGACTLGSTEDQPPVPPS